MKSTSLTERVLIVCLAVILVLLPVHAFVSTWLGTAVGPLLAWKSWKELLLAGLLPLVIYYLWRRPDIAKTLWQRRINQLIAAYVLLHAIVALLTEVNSSALAAGLMINLRFFAMFMLAQLVAESGNPWVAAIKSRLSAWLLGTLAVLAVLAIAQVSILPADFLTHFGYNKDATIAPVNLVDQNPDARRAFATMRGPNTFGAYLLIPLALIAGLLMVRAQALATKKRTYAVLGLLGVTALGLSGSRSAWIGFAVMLATLGFVSLPRSTVAAGIKRFWLPAAACLIALGLAAVTIPAARLAIFHSSPGDDSLLEGSTELHWQVTLDGLALAMQNPLGMGPGNSGPATYYRDIGVNLPENYFVQIAQEVGLIGLALFAIICWLMARQLYTHRHELWPRILLASFAGLTVINIFLHGWADDPTAMTWWGLAGLLAYKPKKS